MEMHQLRYVAAVARTGNFSRAAEQCHVSQPSLSQQIQKLETELGERLFDRLKREAKLTPHGAAFLQRALRVLEEVESATREAKDATSLLRGTVTIGVLPTIAPYLLPRALTEFVATFPGVQVEVQEDTTAQLLKQLAACEIDFAIASQPIRDARVEIRSLFMEELLLALPPKHPLTRKRSITLNELESERFIVMKDGHCLGDQVLNFCERRNLRPTVSFRSAQLETIQSLVCAGMGLSLIPEMAVQASRGESPKYRSLSHPRPTRQIVALWSRQRPPSRAAAKFLDMLSSRFGKTSAK